MNGYHNHIPHILVAYNLLTRHGLQANRLHSRRMQFCPRHLMIVSGTCSINAGVGMHGGVGGRYTLQSHSFEKRLVTQNRLGTNSPICPSHCRPKSTREWSHAPARVHVHSIVTLSALINQSLFVHLS